MRIRTVLVPLTMPLLLAACFGSSGSSGSSWRNFTSFDNISPNQRVQFRSGGDSVNYAAGVVEGNVQLNGDISNEGARVRVRYGPNTSQEPDVVEFEVASLELTVNLPAGGPVVRTFDGEDIVSVGDGLAAGRFIRAEIVTGGEGDDPVVVTDRFYVEDGEEFEFMTFGLWELGLDTNARNIGGAAFGALTRVSGTDSMPTAGTATYNGDLIGYNVLGIGEGATATTVYVAQSQLGANFTANTVTLSSTDTRNLATGVAAPAFDLTATTGTITGNTFSGTGLTIAGLPPAGEPPVPTGGGTFGGAFFGPEAAEAGGWFEMRNLGSNDRYFGSFGGKRGAIDVPEP